MKFPMAVRLVAAIAALFVTAGAGAQGRMGPGQGFGDHRPPMERAFRSHGEHGKWWNNPQIIEKLKLTDDQRKAMDGILQQHREKLIDLRASLEKAEVGMEPLMGAEQPNEQAALAQIDKVAQARAELEKANARFLFALRSKLSPDQWKQLHDMRESHGNREGRDGMRHWDRDRGPRHEGAPGASGEQGPPPPPPGPQGLLDDGPAAPAAPAQGAVQ